MALAQMFQVATEFRFEIGSALLGTKTLTGAVDDLQGRIDDAAMSFQRLGLGIAASLGVGTGGVFALFGKAIQSAEKYKDVQLSIANILAANRDNLVGQVDTFNQRMEVSADLLNKMIKQARQFSLPQAEMIMMSKMLMPLFLSKGMAGKGLGEPIDFARNFLKTSQSLAFDPQQSLGQLMRAIEGGASSGDPMFRRLTMDTKVMREFAGNTKKFNSLEPHKRMEVLSKAFAEFTRDTDTLIARTNTVTGQWRLLRENIAGVGSVLKPLGDVIIPAIVKIFKALNNILVNQVAGTIKNIAQMIKPFVDDLQGTVVTFMQLRSLSQDLRRTGTAVSIIGISSALGGVIKFLGGSALFATPLIGQVAAGIYVLGSAMKRAQVPIDSLGSVFTILAGASVIGAILAKFGKLKVVLMGIGRLGASIIRPLAFFLALFQTISRSVAIAKIEDAKTLPTLMENFSKMLLRAKEALSKIFAPLAAGLDLIAEKFSFLFRRTYMMQAAMGVLEGVVNVLEFFADGVKLIVAAITGIYFEIADFINNIKDFGIGEAFSRFGEAFQKGLFGVIDEDSPFKDKPAVANQVTNIASMKVDIRNDFKENLQPDRIAFTMKDQLMKVAQNPTQARGRSFSKQAVVGRGSTGSW